MYEVQVSQQLGVSPDALAVLAFSFELTNCGDDADLTGRVHTITEVGCSKDRIEREVW